MASYTKRKNRKRILTATLYNYVEPLCAEAAYKKSGVWGSHSNYINYLIAKDNGLTAVIARAKETAKDSTRAVMARPTPTRVKKRKLRLVKAA